MSPGQLTDLRHNCIMARTCVIITVSRGFLTMWFSFKPQLTYSVEDTVIITHLRINFKDNCNFQISSQKA